MNYLQTEDFWVGVLIFMIIFIVLAAIAVPCSISTHDNNIKTRQMISKCYDSGHRWDDDHHLCLS